MAQKNRKASEVLEPILAAGKALKVGDLAAELISALGGTREFAKLYAKEIEEGTKSGSVARARMLDGILRIVSQASAQEKGMERPEDQMSDQELQDLVDDYLTPRSPTADPQNPGTPNSPKSRGGSHGEG